MATFFQVMVSLCAITGFAYLLPVTITHRYVLRGGLVWFCGILVDNFATSVDQAYWSVARLATSRVDDWHKYEFEQDLVVFWIKLFLALGHVLQVGGMVLMVRDVLDRK
jgi:hypothetical protein